MSEKRNTRWKKQPATNPIQQIRTEQGKDQTDLTLRQRQRRAQRKKTRELNRLKNINRGSGGTPEVGDRTIKERGRRLTDN